MIRSRPSVRLRLILACGLAMAAGACDRLPSTDDVLARARERAARFATEVRGLTNPKK